MAVAYRFSAVRLCSVHSKLFGGMLAARPELGEGGNMRPVVGLLVEQVSNITTTHVL